LTLRQQATKASTATNATLKSSGKKWLLVPLRQRATKTSMATNATLKSKRQKILTIINAYLTASDKNLYAY